MEERNIIREQTAASAIRRHAKQIMRYLPKELVDKLVLQEDNIRQAEASLRHAKYEQGNLFKVLGQI